MLWIRRAPQAIEPTSLSRRSVARTDAASGSIGSKRRVSLPTVHDKHNLASPSPVTDGQMVRAWFGTGQIVALDVNGKLVWERNLAKEIAPFEINWGHSSSPTLYQDTLILLCDHAPASYLLAVDKRTGKDRWKADRGKGRMSASTPFVVETTDRAELIVNSSERVDAHDAKTGALLWYVGGSNQFPIPDAGVSQRHSLYEPRLSQRSVSRRSAGWARRCLGDARPGGKCQPAPRTSRRSCTTVAFSLWPATSAPITAIDAETGKRIWQERVDGLFTASPVAADGKIYFVSETGEVIVVRSGREPMIIARNDLGERFMSGLAVSNGQLFLRSDGRLFAIGKRALAALKRLRYIVAAVAQGFSPANGTQSGNSSCCGSGSQKLAMKPIRVHRERDRGGDERDLGRRIGTIRRSPPKSR